MSEWKKLVRERLSLKGIGAERENEIVAELASYAEDAYREAILRGCSENDALDFAWGQVGDCQALAAEFSASGPAVALQTALRTLEDREQAISCRGGLPGLLSSFVQDLRFAVRSLRRRLMFTIVVVVALALGIGATTTVFSVADTALFQDLPYEDADRLVSIWTERQNSRDEWVTASLYPPEYRALRANAETLDNLALYFDASMTLQGLDYPIDLMVGEGTASLSEVSGIRPQLGRWFLPGEDGPDKTRVTVLGDGLWRTEFGADPDILGQTITLDRSLYTVIGVMPPEFRFELGLFEESRGLLSSRESGERPLWVPMGHNYGSDWYYAQEGWSFEAIARLRPGITLGAAQADIAATLDSDESSGSIRVRLAFRNDLDVAGLPSQVLLLAVPSLLLLLIACGNVASLLLGEGVNREAEIATRAALGAGVRRIVRQLLTESLLLGAIGSAVGAGVAFGATRLLVAVAPAGSAAHELQVNQAVLCFACVTGLAAGILFGLFPALTMGWWSKVNITSRLKGRAFSRSRRTVSALVGFEVALTVVLLVAGGLFTRTVWNLFAVDNGFDPTNLIALRTANDHSPRPERPRINQQIVERIEALPGVEGATGSWAVPMVMGLWSDDLEVEEHTYDEGDHLPRVRYDIVLHNYHEVLGIPLLAGRYFTRNDGLDGNGVVLVSESTARTLWPDRSPVGERVRLGRDTIWSTVVGVVGNMRHRGPREEASAPVYIPYVQSPNRNGMRFAITVRTAVDPSAVIPLLATAAREVEPNLLVKEALLIETALALTATDQRYRALIVLIFGTFAVVLAAVGIFGVVARSLAQRTREIAIRVALGAKPADLNKLILQGSFYATSVGIISGLIGAFWASRLLSRFLFGVQSWDPMTYGTVVSLVAVVCLTASYLPARQVLGIQPAEVLKGD